MTKDLFLNELNIRLGKRVDKADIVSFYYEQITDRLENGETEDEIFADIRIDEILLSLNETDSFEEEKRELDIPEPIVYRETKKEAPKSESSYRDAEIQEPVFDKKETTSAPIDENPYSTLSGGRKFWYIVWTIATVCFCIASVCVEIACVGLIIASFCIISAGTALFTQSIGLALVGIGVGLILLGSAIVGMYYAKVLRKFMFGHRIPWNKAIHDKLGGNK